MRNNDAAVEKTTVRPGAATPSPARKIDITRDSRRRRTRPPTPANVLSVPLFFAPGRAPPDRVPYVCVYVCTCTVQIPIVENMYLTPRRTIGSQLRKMKRKRQNVIIGNSPPSSRAVRAFREFAGQNVEDPGARFGRSSTTVAHVPNGRNHFVVTNNIRCVPARSDKRVFERVAISTQTNDRKRQHDQRI